MLAFIQNFRFECEGSQVGRQRRLRDMSGVLSLPAPLGSHGKCWSDVLSGGPQSQQELLSVFSSAGLRQGPTRTGTRSPSLYLH